MKILFRYVAKQYLVNIVTLFVIVAALIVAIDVVINLDRFARRADQILEASGAGGAPIEHSLLTARLVLDLWGPRLLQLFTYLNGMVLIAAAGFTCTQLVRHREFVAMLSCGMSLRRAAAPFLMVGLVFLGLQALVQEIALPRAAHLLPRDPGDAGKPGFNAFALRLTPDAQGRLWYARRFDGVATLEDLAVWERGADGAITGTIVADRATWDGQGWRLTQGIGAFVAGEGGPRTIAPQPIERLETNLDPQRIKIRTLEGFAATTSTRELTRLLTSGADAAVIERLDRLRWSRPAAMLSTYLALIGSLSVFLLRSPRPMIVPALKAVPIAAGGFAASAVSSSASIPGLPVWFGAFLPTLVLLSLATALWTSIDT